MGRGKKDHSLPPGVQQFGHGAPEGYTYQYSNCTGKRKALLIGINYFGQEGELSGCINDVRNVSRFLNKHYNYRRDDMVILTDDARKEISQPTRANILRAIQWLVQGAQPNDALFLHYSGAFFSRHSCLRLFRQVQVQVRVQVQEKQGKKGKYYRAAANRKPTGHGGQTDDLDGDEQDGIDEVIYPVDYEEEGHIVDDDLHRMIVAPLPAGVRLTAIFDSCHSGSVLDLPYIYSTKGVLKEPNLAKEAGQGLLSAGLAYARGDMDTVTSSLFGLAKSVFKGDKGYKKTVQTKTSPADVMMWSGSKDDQTS
jgi:hypothetical protein